MASNQRQGRSSAGLQRLALLASGALLVVLFLGFAIAQGIGNPSVPSDAVAVIEDAPDDLGTITEAELERTLAQAAASAQIKPVPKPGDGEKYEELKETAMGEVLDSIWVQGKADEMGIEVTPKEVSDELEKLKDQAFKTEKQYQEFLKEARFTPADVEVRVKIQMVSTQIQEQVNEEAPKPSSREIENNYEASKAQYTEEEKRDARALVFKDKGKAEKAKADLEEDDSPATWKRLAAKSNNASTKETGGLISNVADGQTPEPLNAAIFSAPQGEVEGLLKSPSGYEVYEVLKITPEKVQSLEEVEAQISGQLTEQLQQQTFARFVRNYGSTWKSRTFCADDFLVERCANFKGDGRPAEANPACYEASPKAPAEACPAISTQVKPAQPGTVSPLNPEGQKLAQRPRPAGEEPAAGAPSESLGAPPTGAPGE